MLFLILSENKLFYPLNPQILYTSLEDILILISLSNIINNDTDEIYDKYDDDDDDVDINNCNENKILIMIIIMIIIMIRMLIMIMIMVIIMIK